MGAQTFGDFVNNTDVKAAFNEAHEQAQWEHGHGGYTGTIAEKSGYKIVQATPVTWAEARALEKKLINESQQVYDDKWGPACAIRVKDDNAKMGWGASEGKPVDGWYFCGWASS